MCAQRICVAGQEPGSGKVTWLPRWQEGRLLSADLAAEGRQDSRNWWSYVLYTAPREAGLCVFLLASGVASSPCYSLAC